MSVVIGTLLVIATMRVGRAFVMPVVIAVLLTLMLTAPTRSSLAWRVNTGAIFLGLLFLYWMWSIPGAVLAVPLAVSVKLVCDHVPSPAHVGELLGH